MNLGHLGRTQQLNSSLLLNDFGAESINLQRLKLPYPGLVAHACNPSPLEAGAGGTPV